MAQICQKERGNAISEAGVHQRSIHHGVNQTSGV